MVVGKTMWLSFNLALTSMANVNALAMLLPAGMYNAGEYTTQAFIYYDQQTIGYGMAQCSPNDVLFTSTRIS
jgi:hypothetical protein